MKLEYIRFSLEQLEGFCIYKYDVPIKNLPKDLEGFTILQLSDLHLKQYDEGRKEKLKIIKEKIQKPDLVICTGDYVSDSVEDLDSKSLELLSEITCREKLFVLGNHDYLNKKDTEAANQITKTMESAGYKNITNSNFNIRGINIYGVDDIMFGNPKTPFVNDPDKCNILAMHNLDALNDSYQDCFDLILSGHLHSGEINVGIFDGIDYLKLIGSYQNLNEQKRGWKEIGRALSYISPGLSSHIARVGVEQEVVTLHRLVRYNSVE